MTGSDITLYNENAMDVLKRIPSHSIDCIFTDPPYDVDIQGGGWLSKKDRFEKALGEVKENGFGDGYDIVGYGEEFLRVCKEPNIFVWCNKKQIPKYLNYYLGRKNLNFEILTWHRTNPMPAYSRRYLTDTDFLLYFKGRGVCNPNCYEDAKTFYVSPANKKERNLYKHPTIKPVEFIEPHIRNATQEGMTVLDTFMGSGSTGVACLRNNRKFIGVEINKDYMEIAKDRIYKEM